MIADKLFNITAGGIRVFNSDFPIKSKEYIRLFLDEVGDGVTYITLTEGLYDVINESVVFDTAPVGAIIVLQVATTPDELSANPSETTLLVGMQTEILALYGSLDAIDSVGTDVAKGIGTNQPTDSAILNALTNATQTQADVILTNADVVSTNADVVLTHADVGFTNADVVTTGNNVTASSGFADASEISKIASGVWAGASQTSANESASSATASELSAWEAEAEALTATSYATEAIGVEVNIVTSDGDGTFTYTPQTGMYSALHYQNSSEGVPNLAVTNTTNPSTHIDTQNGSINVINGIGGATFERTQTTVDSTTYADRDGLLSYYSNNEPRRGKYGTPLEPQATNKLLESNTITTTPWSRLDIALPLQDAIAPTGLTEAWTLIASASSGYLNQKVPQFTSGDIFTSSVYLKQSTNNNTSIFRVYGTVEGTSGILSMHITWTDGIPTLGTTHEVALNWKVEELYDGWYRFSMTATLDIDDIDRPLFRIYPTTGASSASVLYYGGQLEEGSIATSYTPTGIATVQRNVETFFIDPKNWPSIVSGVTVETQWYSDDWSLNNVGDIARWLFHCGGTATSDYVGVYINNGVLSAITRNDGTFHIITTNIADNRIDIKFVLGATNNYLYVNGFFVGSIARAINIMNLIPNSLSIGRYFHLSGREANAEHLWTKINGIEYTPAEARL